jgi:hypothetical protein
MLSPKRILAVRAATTPRRIPPTRLIRRPGGGARVRTILQGGTYAALLNLEERAEKSRDALRAGDDIAPAVIGREILALANLAARGLNVLNDVRP